METKTDVDNMKPFIKAKLVTWNKDSNGLFDYESKSVDLKEIRIESSCEIYQLSKIQKHYFLFQHKHFDTSFQFQVDIEMDFKVNESFRRKKDASKGDEIVKKEFRVLDQPVEIVNKHNLNSKNALFLAGFDLVQQSFGRFQFQFNAFIDSLNTFSANYLSQESYLIVRSLKDKKNNQKGYELQIGDLVKFGRLEFQVIQIKNANGDVEMRNISKQNLIESRMKEVQNQPKKCQICLGEDQSDENFFCNPSTCDENCKYFHIKCLQNWIQPIVKQKKNDNSIKYTLKLKNMDLELCQHAFSSFNMNDLLDIDIPQGFPYIIFESVHNSKNMDKKILFIIFNQVEETQTKIGRKSDGIEIKDTSVSRVHSTIKYKDDKFIIFDNNSKFGTLIKINQNLDITSDKMAVQIGRTVISFRQKMGALIGCNQIN